MKNPDVSTKTAIISMVFESVGQIVRDSVRTKIFYDTSIISYQAQDRGTHAFCCEAVENAVALSFNKVSRGS